MNRGSFSIVRACLALAIAIGSVAIPATERASAQSSTLDAFRPAPNSRDGFAVSAAETRGTLRLDAQLYLDYANDPLVYETVLGSPSSEQLQIVRHQLALHGLLSLTIHDRLLVYVGIPVNAVMRGESPGALGVFPADGASMGDVHVGARVRIFGNPHDGFSLAAQGTLYFPTSQIADDIHYAGDKTMRLHAQVLGQYRLRPIRIAANLGAMFRGRQDIPGGIDLGQQLTFGLGVSVPLLDESLAVIAELHGTTTFNDFFDREQTALEALVGGRYFHDSGLNFGLGAGPGLVRGYGSPDVRILGSIGFAREFREDEHDSDGDGIGDEHDRCPSEPEDRDGFRDEDGCPDPDNDGDGILDADDACANDPEDADGFEDANGCPDPDNDGDGIADAADACPLEPEDRDGFEDDNGCPDPDNDGDGVLDTEDRCPLEAGPANNQGCPNPDRDGDTVVDRQDNCPDEPGPVENQGCQIQQQVRIEDGRLAILDSVYFRTNSDVIQPRSFALLDNVAIVLDAHPEITAVRIEGHTDSRGNRDRNVRLSQARAESVMRYLVSKGVDASRLSAHGFGPDRPIVPDARSNADHARNRRVEFNIEGGEGVVETRSSAPTEDTIDR